MTRKQFQTFFKQCQAKEFKIMMAKNADYTKGVAEDDPFANFRQCEKFGITSAEIGFLTRMSDKFARIASFAKKGELMVKDETVEDTCLDLSNYLKLFLGYLAEKKAAMAPKKKAKRPSRSKAAIAARAAATAPTPEMKTKRRKDFKALNEPTAVTQ